MADNTTGNGELSFASVADLVIYLKKQVTELSVSLDSLATVAPSEWHPGQAMEGLEAMRAVASDGRYLYPEEAAPPNEPIWQPGDNIPLVDLKAQLVKQQNAIGVFDDVTTVLQREVGPKVDGSASRVNIEAVTNARHAVGLEAINTIDQLTVPKKHMHLVIQHGEDAARAAKKQVQDALYAAYDKVNAMQIHVDNVFDLVPSLEQGAGIDSDQLADLRTQVDYGFKLVSGAVGITPYVEQSKALCAEVDAVVTDAREAQNLAASTATHLNGQLDNLAKYGISPTTRDDLNGAIGACYRNASQARLYAGGLVEVAEGVNVISGLNQRVANKYARTMQSVMTQVSGATSNAYEILNQVVEKFDSLAELAQPEEPKPGPGQAFGGKGPETTDPSVNKNPSQLLGSQQSSGLLKGPLGQAPNTRSQGL